MIEPRYMNFGRLKCGDVVTREVKLKFPDPDKGVHLTDIEYPEGHLLVEKGKEDPNEIVIKISTREEMPLGRFSDKILFKTSSKKLPEVKLSVSAYVTGDIEISPERLTFFKKDEGEEPITKTVTLTKTNGEGKFAVTKVEFSSDRFKTEIVEEEPGVKVKISVTTTVEEGAKGLRENMTIFTNDPKQEKIQIPVVLTNIDRSSMMRKDMKKLPIKGGKEPLRRFDPANPKMMKGLHKKPMNTEEKEEKE